MADDKGQATRRPRWTRTADFEAPERGSADELLDAGAHAPIDAMRHSTAHVMAEAVLDLFPGAKLGIGPAIHDGFYYDFDLPRPLTPDDLEAIEGRMRASRRGRPRVRPQGDPVGRRPRARGADGPAVQGRDPRRPRAQGAGGRRRRCRRPASTSTARSATCARAPTSSRRARSARSSCSPSPAPTGGATRSGRCSSGSTARSGRRRSSSTSTSYRREEAKKRDHRKLGVAARPVLFHDVSPGSAFWHPKGQRIWRTLESAMRELQERRGYDEVSTPILVSERLWHQSGHWDHYAENMFIVEAEGQTVQPQADELPRVDVHLPLATCARTATCRCATTSTGGSTATSAQARCPA